MDAFRLHNCKITLSASSCAESQFQPALSGFSNPHGTQGKKHPESMTSKVVSRDEEYEGEEQPLPARSADWARWMHDGGEEFEEAIRIKDE